ncbi:MAG TPA: hypothetical protein VJ995_00535 [Geothermobacteraceae bacterium]|nr:hypothetical protein [Geothermobacteraceae bacterium]
MKLLILSATCLSLLLAAAATLTAATIDIEVTNATHNIYFTPLLITAHPAGGGEGFNPMRDDRDYVAIHPGVVTAAEGLASSALHERHRFQSPVARLLVTRID